MATRPIPGWVDPYTFGDCSPATVARKVDWGVLSLIFSDLSSYADGRRHFIGWEYGLVGQIGDEPVGLRTPGRMTLGSRVVDLLAEFPEAGVNEGESDLDIPPNFYVSDNFRGLLTGTSTRRRRDGDLRRLRLRRIGRAFRRADDSTRSTPGC